MSVKPTSVPTKRLAGSILSTEMAFRVDNILGWDGNALTAADFGTQAYGVFRDSARTRIELFEFDPSTIASATITINKRGLKFDGDRTTEETNNKFDWTAGDTYVDLGTDTPQIIQYFQDYIDALAIAGSPLASTTVSGLVEEATDAEVAAGTQTGGTGARLFINPASIGTYITTLTEPVVRTYVTAGSPHTWTKPAGLKYIVVEVQAGGGVGGAASGATYGGGGGGGGGYSKRKISAASLAATETVTVGASAGNSSFGTLCTATAGSTGGNSGTDGGAGGVGASGDINITGGGGCGGTSGTSTGGAGGSSYFGSGGQGAVGNDRNGFAGGNYGGGGGGAATQSSGSQSGGAGGPGIVIVTEYYF